MERYCLESVPDFLKKHLLWGKEFSCIVYCQVWVDYFCYKFNTHMLAYAVFLTIAVSMCRVQRVQWEYFSSIAALRDILEANFENIAQFCPYELFQERRYAVLRGSGSSCDALFTVT